MDINGQIEKLRSERPSDWSAMPDISLYMDQVLSYMGRQLSYPGVGISKPLTAAMVNNYIKSGLLPRAEKKLYSREHIALLTAVCVLKQVMTTKDLGSLLAEINAQENTREFYEKLLQSIDRELTETALALSPSDDRHELALTALELAVAAYSRQLACLRIIELLRDSGDGGESETDKKKSKK